MKLTNHVRALIVAAEAAVDALTIGAKPDKQDLALALLTAALKPYDVIRGAKALRVALAWHGGRDSSGRYFLAKLNKSRFLVRHIDGLWWVRYTPDLGERHVDLGASPTLKKAKIFCSEYAEKQIRLKAVPA